VPDLAAGQAPSPATLRDVGVCRSGSTGPVAWGPISMTRWLPSTPMPQVNTEGQPRGRLRQTDFQPCPQPSTLSRPRKGGCSRAPQSRPVVCQCHASSPTQWQAPKTIAVQDPGPKLTSDQAPHPWSLSTPSRLMRTAGLPIKGSFQPSIRNVIQCVRVIRNRTPFFLNAS